jgi:hypothetical protein
MSEAHYLNKLYPMQDIVLHLFNDEAIQLYLTGGTALSRAFLNHRYSDDLDFFLNDNPDFENETDRATSVLQKKFEKVTIDNKQSGFRKLFLENDNVTLKLDFVNDDAYHFTGFQKTTIYYRTDNPLNILSNKIAALNRQAAKDIADIIWICRKYSFTWPDMIGHAAQKDNWANEVDVLTAIKTFDQEKLITDVAWTVPADPSAINHDIKKICFDIASAGSNSLFSPDL